MRITDISTLLVVVVAALTGRQLLLLRGTEAAPAEGLTPFSFLMARAYGEPAQHPIMHLMEFKPSDGAKFRETFEKKHGPRGRDLIDSLGRGSYKTTSDVSIFGASLRSLTADNPSESQ